MRCVSRALSAVGWLKRPGARAAMVTAVSTPACIAEAAINRVRLLSRLISYPFMKREATSKQSLRVRKCCAAQEPICAVGNVLTRAKRYEGLSFPAIAIGLDARRGNAVRDGRF